MGEASGRNGAESPSFLPLFGLAIQVVIVVLVWILADNVKVLQRGFGLGPLRPSPPPAGKFSLFCVFLSSANDCETSCWDFFRVSNLSVLSTTCGQRQQLTDNVSRWVEDERPGELEAGGPLSSRRPHL